MGTSWTPGSFQSLLANWRWVLVHSQTNILAFLSSSIFGLLLWLTRKMCLLVFYVSVVPYKMSTLSGRPIHSVPIELWQWDNNINWWLTAYNALDSMWVRGQNWQKTTDISFIMFPVQSWCHCGKYLPQGPMLIRASSSNILMRLIMVLHEEYNSFSWCFASPWRHILSHSCLDVELKS